MVDGRFSREHGVRGTGLTPTFVCGRRTGMVHDNRADAFGARWRRHRVRVLSATSQPGWLTVCHRSLRALRAVAWRRVAFCVVAYAYPPPPHASPYCKLLDGRPPLYTLLQPCRFLWRHCGTAPTTYGLGHGLQHTLLPFHACLRRCSNMTPYIYTMQFFCSLTTSHLFATFLASVHACLSTLPHTTAPWFCPTGRPQSYWLAFPTCLCPPAYLG